MRSKTVQQVWNLKFSFPDLLRAQPKARCSPSALPTRDLGAVKSARTLKDLELYCLVMGD